jgi:hypothetical protein
MGRQSLVNRCLRVTITWGSEAGKLEGAYLEHLRAQSVLVKIGLGQAFESVFTTIPNRSGKGGDIVKVDSADRREILGRRRVPRQDLTDLVDDGVTSGTEGLDNLELDRGCFEIVVAVVMVGGNREEPNPFTLKVQTLADNITWEENVLDWRRMGGSGSRVLGRDIGAAGVESGKNGGTRNGTGGCDASGVRHKRDGGSPGRSSDRGGRIGGEHVVGRPCGTVSGETTSMIGGLSGGERLGIP